MEPVLRIPDIDTRDEAIALQLQLKERVRIGDAVDPGTIRSIAGADVSYARDGGTGYAAVVTFTYPQIEFQNGVCAASGIRFPYIPGLLAFREVPILLEAFSQLEEAPDVVLFDGHGVAHPRGFGIASHMGVLLDTPSIGVAKRILTGRFSDPPLTRGSASPIRSDGNVIGMAVRTSERAAPVFVSVGHRFDLESAVKVVLTASRGYRLPEPIRQAHQLANRARIRGIEDRCVP
ncbi:MAG: deoxyribonuclease V [Methanomicrobiales archaeon]|nr:deoxyribonuclease V [Methanomicrobiales archaeon]MDI6875247.1 deoxyribonuclease V [Methanomicrobiales archaeon]